MLANIFRTSFLYIQRNIDAHKPITTLLNSHNRRKFCEEKNDDFIETDSDYETLVDKYLNVTTEHKCFIIQPYIKWGPQKLKTSPQCQLDEAISLVNSLRTWKVIDTIVIPLDNFEKKVLFGKGTLTKLVQMIRVNPGITSVFINISTLKNIQFKELEQHFNKPIFDRYNIVIQIFRLHAMTKQAKLQVALAEIPFLQNRLRKHDTDFVTSSAVDIRNFILQTREKKIREAIKRLKSHRELLRHKRIKANFPVVAVVGYTNVGKTSLIKALTNDNSLVPRDQLFATLDVTFHAGLLPSKMKVLYVDTVGFLSNIPTELIDCFKATLEDALLADVILHVEDMSSKDFLYQRTHVLNTLEDLSQKMGGKAIKSKIVSVGNKCDLQMGVDESILKVSAKNEVGIDLLKLTIEEKILQTTNRHIISISLPIGGNEIRWLYKNATVLSVKEDEEDSQNHLVKIIITEPKLNEFKHNFII